MQAADYRRRYRRALWATVIGSGTFAVLNYWLFLLFREAIWLPLVAAPAGSFYALWQFQPWIES